MDGEYNSRRSVVGRRGEKKADEAEGKPADFFPDQKGDIQESSLVGFAVTTDPFGDRDGYHCTSLL